mgnify:CR=1 FL=1
MLFKITLLTVLFTITGLAIAAQDEPVERRAEARRPMMPRPMEAGSLLRRLGLSPEQIAAIRDLNVERRDDVRRIHEAVRIAEADLDKAIYADVVNDEEVKTRLATFQAAQSDLARLRYMNELAIRRILTPEQLVQFRKMRERFDRGRNVPPRRGVDGGVYPRPSEGFPVDRRPMQPRPKKAI